MGRAMLSKSLMQFSVDGWSRVASLLLTWSQTMEQVMKTVVVFFKGPMPARLHSMPAALQRATANPCHHQNRMDTHRQVLDSLLWGDRPFLLVHIRFCLCPPRVCFPSCVGSGGSTVGLMATSHKRTYAIPISAAPEPHILRQSTADPYFHRRHSNTVVSQSLLIIIL